jgi:uncharacterized repeat protein (TIGR01451 family)
MSTPQQRITFVFLIACALLGVMAAVLNTQHTGPVVALAQGTVRYVATTGIDSGTCTIPASPCRTVQYGVDQAASGDQVHVATGTYVTINNHGGLAQIVYVSKTLTLRGGYNADFSVWNPDTYGTTLDADSNGRVVYITGNISPTLEGLTITRGDATGLEGGSYAYSNGGGGVYVVSATATISGNMIANNVASADDYDGLGGGIYLLNSDSRVLNNTIQNNDASTLDDFIGASGWGGGLYAEGGAPLVRGNAILNNQAGIGGGFFGYGDGGGLAFVESTPTVEANEIRGNRAASSGGYGAGGGVELAGCPDSVFINNIIADNVASDGGTGVWVGRMSGVPSDGRFLHNTIASNQGDDWAAAIRIEQGSVVTLTNTIIVDHEIGLYAEQTTTVQLEGTLWGSGAWANTTNWESDGTLTSTVEITGTPDFVTPGSGNYHIGAASDAVDAGVDAGIDTDIDGDARDANPDIGADELAGGWGIRLSKVASAALVTPGDTLTYFLTATGSGALGATNVHLTDTLPTLQQPQSADTDKGSCIITDNGYGGQVTCDLGDLVATQSARVTITVQVTTTLPATLPQTMRNTARVTSDQAGTEAFAETSLHNCHARVDGAGPTYSTVQAAVDAAGTGSTVQIAGTCVGATARGGTTQQVLLTKTIALQGGYATDFTSWDPEVYTTTLDAGGAGRIVTVQGAVVVTLTDLLLTGGDATGQGGGLWGFGDAGGGLFLITGTATLDGVTLRKNVASTNSDGYGGGVAVTTGTLTLVDSVLVDNVASTAPFGLGYGGGLHSVYATVTLDRSRLENNVAADPLAGFGGGAAFEASTIVGTSTFWYENATSSLDWGEGGAVYVDGTQPFTLTNCVLARNRAATAGSALFVSGATGTLLHPTIAHGAGEAAIQAEYTATIAITNAIIASHTLGIQASEDSTVTVAGVLWHQNVTNTFAGSATVQVSHAITGDPAFVAPDIGDYHLSVNSAAIDQGISANVATDMDGTPRPQYLGYDLGAYEYSNAAPIADAGDDQTVPVNSTVILDGSGSSDPDNHLPLSYGWRQIGGEPATLLDDATSPSPTFTAPGSDAVLTFTLVVTDALGLASAPDEVVITVTSGPLPMLYVFKSVDTGGLTAVPVDGVITYTITISNSGTGLASGVVMTDPLPSGVSFGGWVGGAPGTVTLPEPDLLDWRADVAAGVQYTLVFTATVTNAAQAGADIINIAYYRSDGMPIQTASDAGFTVEGGYDVYLPLVLRN